MFDRLDLFGGQRTQTAESCRKLRTPHSVHLLPKAADYRHHRQTRNPLPVFLRFLRDDLLRRRDVLFTPLEICRRGGAKVVEIVEKDVVHLSDRDFNVPRQRDVENAQRPVATGDH